MPLLECGKNTFAIKLEPGGTVLKKDRPPNR